MPKIEIKEIDKTTPGVVASNNEIVYIPGFVDVATNFPTDASKALEVNVPTLFTSLSEFESKCGTAGFIFPVDQTYSMLPYSFDTKAIPEDNILIPKGTTDPGYVMAKELLAAGLSVMYERINGADAAETSITFNTQNPFVSGSSYFDYEVALPLTFYGITSDDGEGNVTRGNITATDVSINKESVTVGKVTLYKWVVTATIPENNIVEKITATLPYISASMMYQAFETIYNTGDYGLADVGNYSIKYLTSGGYPVYEYNSGGVVTKMLALAAKRGDCFALIDHTYNLDREQNISDGDSLFACINADNITNGDYGTMFTPWCGYNRITSDVDATGKPHFIYDPADSQNTIKLEAKTSDVLLPASYAYLAALADSIQTNASWLAIAGVARGLVPNLSTNGIKTDIPNGVADAMQPRDPQTADDERVAINAITNIKPYGQTIWGNRTLKKITEGLVATSFLNIRNLVCDVKKVVYTAARSLTFEQNTDILWVNFKSKIAPTLDRMQSGYGISGYKILRDTEHEKATEKATVCAKIILYPVYAVEDFYITVVLSDDEVTVE